MPYASSLLIVLLIDTLIEQIDYMIIAYYILMVLLLGTLSTINDK